MEAKCLVFPFRAVADDIELILRHGPLNPLPQIWLFCRVEGVLACVSVLCSIPFAVTLRVNEQS